MPQTANPKEFCSRIPVLKEKIRKKVMRSLSPPRSNWSIILIILLGFILFFQVFTTPVTRDLVILVGVFLEIMGAGMLVIPDIPSLNYFFESGRLRRAHETLTHDSPGRFLIDPKFFRFDREDRSEKIPDTLKGISGEFIGRPICHHEGFYETLDLFREWECDREKEIKVWEYVFAFVPTGFFTMESYDENYIDVWIIVDEPHQEIDINTPHSSIQKFDLPQHIEERINELETRFRRSGLIFITFGFLYQGAAILLL